MGLGEGKEVVGGEGTGAVDLDDAEGGGGCGGGEVGDSGWVDGAEDSIGFEDGCSVDVVTGDDSTDGRCEVRLWGRHSNC